MRQALEVNRQISQRFSNKLSIIVSNFRLKKETERSNKKKRKRIKELQNKRSKKSKKFTISQYLMPNRIIQFTKLQFEMRFSEIKFIKIPTTSLRFMQLSNTKKMLYSKLRRLQKLNQIAMNLQRTTSKIRIKRARGQA